ncbi:MAG TPA: hypothetical protein VF719_09475, partial [Abditibacteriaceae bacterium]
MNRFRFLLVAFALLTSHSASFASAALRRQLEPAWYKVQAALSAKDGAGLKAALSTHGYRVARNEHISRKL